MAFVIFDTEYTSWEGCQENGWADWQEKEIVQIAALKIDDALQLIDEFEIYIKPKINPVLSDYFINLTGITNEKIAAEGVSFDEGYARFKAFVGDCLCYSHAWGAPKGSLADGDIINKNLWYCNIIDDNPLHYCNIAPWFKQRYAEEGIDIQSQCSGDIAHLLKCDAPLKPLSLEKHNAFYDVYSILYGLKALGFSVTKKS